MYIYTLRRIQEFVCVGSHQLNRYKCVNVPYYIYQSIPYGIKRYPIIFVLVSILVRWFVRSFVCNTRLESVRSLTRLLQFGRYHTIEWSFKDQYNFIGPINGIGHQGLYDLFPLLDTHNIEHTTLPL